MIEPMSDERLKSIRERCEKATPGPWANAGSETPEYGAVVDKVVSTGVKGVRFIAEVGNRYAKRTSRRTFADSWFIANARTDIPDLLAEIDRLKKEYAGAMDRDSREHRSEYE